MKETMNIKHLHLKGSHILEVSRDLEDQLFFKIPIEKLKNNKNAYYLYTKEKYRGPAEDIEDDEIKLLEIENYNELKGITRETFEYYKIQNERGNRFGLFPFIPHLFSIGDVEIKNVETIIWTNLISQRVELSF